MEVLGHNKSLKGAGQVSPGCVRNCSLGTIVASTVASSRQCGCRPVHAERSPGADVIAAAPVTSPEQKRRRWFQIIVTSFVLTAGVNLTVVAGENLTVGSTVWLPAESVAPGR
jgi:hypothetical protein